MKRTGKLLYVPGLISLIGLLVAIPSFYKKVAPVKEYCLPLFMPKDCNGYPEMEYDFTSCHLEKAISKKRKLQFTLNENGEENKIKMSLIRYEALKLKYTGDTSTVILIALSDSISYGELISLYDMCEYDKHKRYASWDNKFVIFGEWPEKKKIESKFSCFLCNDVIRIKEPITKPTRFKLINQNVQKYYTPQGLYLILGWIVLLISFFYFKRGTSILKKN
jgi:hypothetical protein